MASEEESESMRGMQRDYIPSTWPGFKALHIYLQDGQTSIFDLFGPDYLVHVENRVFISSVMTLLPP